MLNVYRPVCCPGLRVFLPCLVLVPGLCSCVVCRAFSRGFRSVPGPVLLVGGDPRTDPFLRFLARRSFGQVSLHSGVVRLPF